MKSIAPKSGIMILIVIAVGLMATPCYSQSSQEQFQKHYQISNSLPANHHFMAQEVSGGDILTSYAVTSPAGGLVLFITRTNCCGEVKWMRKYESHDGVGDYQVIIHEVDGSAYVIAGTNYDCGDTFLMKVDADDGHIIWCREFGVNG